MDLSRAALLSLARATGCAVDVGDSVFLCDPHWSGTEMAAFSQLTAGHASSHAGETGWLGIRTGGSGGGMKFARHDERTLLAAVRGFCAHFALQQVNAVDVLPAHHVSGFMARVRCAATGGTHVAWDWKKLEAGELPDLHGSPHWVLSLVPTQLQRLLASPVAVAWLRHFAVVFLGGGPTWPELADAAAHAGLRVSLSYGMTETAAMVAALRPADFLAGYRSCGAALPHAKLTLTSEGLIVIAGDSLFRGYVGEPGEALSAGGARRFVTSDFGRFDERHHLHVLGRADAVIITGGKKVNPADVEAVLRASGEFADIAVIGVPDPEWGQVVVACHPASAHAPNLTRATAALAPHQRPKRFVAIAHWPRNAQGKIDRAALARLAQPG